MDPIVDVEMSLSNGEVGGSRFGGDIVQSRVSGRLIERRRCLPYLHIAAAMVVACSISCALAIRLRARWQVSVVRRPSRTRDYAAVQISLQQGQDQLRRLIGKMGHSSARVPKEDALRISGTIASECCGSSFVVYVQVMTKKLVPRGCKFCAGGQTPLWKEPSNIQLSGATTSKRCPFPCCGHRSPHYGMRAVLKVRSSVGGIQRMLVRTATPRLVAPTSSNFVVPPQSLPC